jgi:hypothetical protein
MITPISARTLQVNMHVTFLKNILFKVSPELYYTIASYRFFRRCKLRFEKFQNELQQCMFHDEAIKVQSGPFSGLKYYNKIIWGALTPKWLGCYEMELDEVIQKVIDDHYKLIIDVGAAEGYYAIGLAYRMPNAHVISYDVDPIARFRQKQLSDLNKTFNLEICKLCSHDELEKRLKDTSQKRVIICDIEGGESELLDPIKCKILETCDILVELHRSDRMTDAQIKALLVDRFTKSHTIHELGQKRRSPDELRQRIPKLANLKDDTILRAADECRYAGQVWLWMQPKLN